MRHRRCWVRYVGAAPQDIPQKPQITDPDKQTFQAWCLTLYNDQRSDPSRTLCVLPPEFQACHMLSPAEGAEESSLSFLKWLREQSSHYGCVASIDLSWQLQMTCREQEGGSISGLVYGFMDTAVRLTHRSVLLSNSTTTPNAVLI